MWIIKGLLSLMAIVVQGLGGCAVFVGRFGVVGCVCWKELRYVKMDRGNLAGSALMKSIWRVTNWSFEVSSWRRGR